MVVLLTKNTKCLVQGITGGQGIFHTKLMLDYGTMIVAGTTPGKGGQKVEGVPVYDSVTEALKNHPSIEATSIWVPAPFVKDAVFEAVHSGLKLVVLIPEHIPVHDSIQIRSLAEERSAIVIGGNSPGIITPGQAKIGIFPPLAVTPGNIGVITRSGSLSYEACSSINAAGFGQSTVIGMGGDKVVGTPPNRLIKLFVEDEYTEAIVLLGEIGGLYEERAAEYIGTIKKPVVAFVAGSSSPPEKRMGHQGAVIERGLGAWENKVKALQDSGAHVVDSPAKVGPILKKILG